MISIIVPVYNEKESVKILHSELIEVLQGVGQPFEIIFVDDGSTDGTNEELRKLRPAKILLFARNYGKSQALQAGFRAAKGDYVFTLDGDLQDDPREIPEFLKYAVENDIDLVCGWKKDRRDGFAKNMVSKVANALTGFFTGARVHDMNCGFKLYRRNVVETIDLYGDMHRYIPAIAVTHGFRIGEIPVHHRERKFGASKYGNLRRLPKSFFDFVTLLLIRRFIDRPMHLFGIIGSASAFAGFSILSYLAMLKLVYGLPIGQRPLLTLGIMLVVVGIQLFSSGFLGELLIRKNNGRNIYVIREKISVE